MIHRIPSAERHHADMGWLSTYWHFSFADYYDPANLNWGALRVFNDDVIQPGQGFGMHPHRDMEIVTAVLDGELEHRDSIGNTGVLRPGEVQVMSAGRGIVHAERNPSKTRPLHLLQIWIQPRRTGSEPRWEQRPFPAAGRAGRLLPVVSSGDIPETLAIDQDAAVYLASLRAGQAVAHRMPADRKGYLFAISGSVDVNGTRIDAGDQARIENEPETAIRAREEAELILLDVPEV